MATVCTPLLLLATGCLPLTPLAPSARPARVVAADSFARRMVAQEQAINPASFPARSVAVVPLQVFTQDTTLHVLGFGLADLLMTDLARSAQLVVVDRLRLDAVLREQQLAESGRVDEATAPRTGRLIGARTLVMGEVRDASGTELALATRLVTATDASIRGGPASRADVNQLLEAEKRLASELFARLGVALTPREQQAFLERPTASLAALLAYSRGVRREMNGDLRGARADFEEAARIDRSFRQAQERVVQLSQYLGESVGGLTSRLAALTALTVDATNRPSVPVRSDTVDPAFTNARRLATLILTF
ncbi:MAG: CsgG/HfaB family protein, partial [Gemmatimonadota bacterium]